MRDFTSLRTLLAAAIIVGSSLPVGATDRTVLMEYFTATW